MATENFTDEEHAARVKLACDALLQVDAMVDMFRREADHECFDLVLKASLPRIKDLTSVMLSALGSDHGRETAEMSEVVHG